MVRRMTLTLNLRQDLRRWLLRCRMELACELLRCGITVKEAAGLLSYTTNSNQ
jgi:AraC-like DNA-binding protein